MRKEFAKHVPDLELNFWAYCHKSKKTSLSVGRKNINYHTVLTNKEESQGKNGIINL